MRADVLEVALHMASANETWLPELLFVVTGESWPLKVYVANGAPPPSVMSSCSEAAASTDGFFGKYAANEGSSGDIDAQSVVDVAKVAASSSIRSAKVPCNPKDVMTRASSISVRHRRPSLAVRTSCARRSTHLKARTLLQGRDD